MMQVLLRNAGFLFFFLAAVLLVSPLYAQNAGFSGTVLDPSNQSIAGAEVMLTNEANGAVRKTTTEADGRFVFTQLAPGKYRAEVSAPGFKKSVRAHLELLVGITSELDIKL